MQDYGYIDIHSHILYGVDDGSQSIEESMDLILNAYEEGIRAIVLTPHYQLGRYMTPVDEIANRFSLLRERVKEKAVPMQLSLGNEIMYSQDILPKLRTREIVRMGVKSRYVLVEFYPSCSWNVIQIGVQSILMEGCVPVIAHIERYQPIMDDWHRIEKLKSLGAHIQMNSSTVTYMHGKLKTRGKLRDILEDDYIDFVATDTHGGHRLPKMKACRKVLTSILGEEGGKKILHDNPIRMLHDQDI